MSQALLGLSRLTIIEKIARIRAITKATATNINFKTPEPTLAEIEAAVDLLELRLGSCPHEPTNSTIKCS